MRHPLKNRTHHTQNPNNQNKKIFMKNFQYSKNDLIIWFENRNI